MKLLSIILVLGIFWGFTHPQQRVRVQGTSFAVPSIQPTVTPSPTPTPSAKEVMQEIVELWGDERPDRILKILECFYSESDYRYNALHVNKSGSTDHGPAQINSVHTKRYGDNFKTNWKENLRVALSIYKDQGLNPWYGSRCQ